MFEGRKLKVFQLLKGIENGDPNSVTVVNEDKYIQHNPQTQEGGEGLAKLFARLSKTNPKVEIVRLFEDGDYIFGHTIYDFTSLRIGFEVFRFEGESIVEHWDNIQPKEGEMVGGTTTIEDFHKTETNRAIIKDFIKSVFIGGEFDQFGKFVAISQLIDHSPLMKLAKKAQTMTYQTNHRFLAEGNFVLSVTEGYQVDIHTSFYDLFRLADGKVVEHWDTTEKVPPQIEWKNNNGKF